MPPGMSWCCSKCGIVAPNTVAPNVAPNVTVSKINLLEGSTDLLYNNVSENGLGADTRFCVISLLFGSELCVLYIIFVYQL